MASFWLLSALATAGLVLSPSMTTSVSAMGTDLRLAAAPSYRGRNPCPTSCSLSGMNPANWTAYHSMDALTYCKQDMFYSLSIYGNADDTSKYQRIYACTNYNGAYSTTAEGAKQAGPAQTLSDANFTIGRWNDNSAMADDLSSVSLKMYQFLSAGYSMPGDGPLVLFAKTLSSTVGIYSGKDIVVSETVPQALLGLETTLTASNYTYGSVAMQLCGPGYDGDHVFGFIAVGNHSFIPVEQALQSWANATCLDLNETSTYVGTAAFTSPLTIGTNSSTSALNGTSASSSSGNSTAPTSRVRIRDSGSNRLAIRDDCTTIQIVSGDTCATLATKCGITAAEFTDYNPSSTLCSTLTPGEHVCCSSGTLPDFQPQPSVNGTCYSYTVQSGDTCSTLAASYDLTIDEIDSFNNNTWGWEGCDDLLLGAVICLSTGDPPMPAFVASAECGPQVPGTVMPASGTLNISGLNPCPLNACCDIWGECGITIDFCNDTRTGAPGTAASGTNGCISNCGTEIIQGDAPETFIALAYYEGYGMDRACLYQDISQVDISSLTHLHFAFGSIDANNSINTGSVLSTFEFERFKLLGDEVHKVLSFGGWTFSTNPSTYTIFRDGVTSTNRVAFATALANYIIENDLDGIDIDWEYPGEPDIPGIPAGSTDDGQNYLDFLIVLKNLLPGKTVSIAAPASYWYLKGFPIAEMSEIVDYIVYMTYDLHGQWDYGNENSQDGCPGGNCLRSHVNLTETLTALSMITKAGVPSSKVVVGVATYGRSFAMAEAGCYDVDCTFTGSATASNAEEGECTETAGYIANAEIDDIISGVDDLSITKRRPGGKRDTAPVSSRVVTMYVEEGSNSNILVYDDIQWVAYMDSDILASRQALYQGYSLGGSTNWASDLEQFNDAPTGVSSWANLKLDVASGIAGFAEGNRTGNWTSLYCNNSVLLSPLSTSEEAWDQLDCADAWSDAVNVYNTIDSLPPNDFTFSRSVANTFEVMIGVVPNCGDITDLSECNTVAICEDHASSYETGPAGYIVWNSLVVIHQMYETLYQTVTGAAAEDVDPQLNDFVDTFAPVSAPSDTNWEQILLDIISLGATLGASSFFTGVVGKLPFFTEAGDSLETASGTAEAFVSFGTAVGSLYVSGSSGSWSVDSQEAFQSYFSTIFNNFSDVYSNTLEDLFNGSSASIELLTETISDGKIAPSGNGVNITAPTDLMDEFSKAIFAYAIPSIWSAAGMGAFVLASGADCSDPTTAAGTYITSSDIANTSVCIDSEMYFLVYPDGSFTRKSAGGCLEPDTNCGGSQFSALPGTDSLGSTLYGGVTVTDLVTGSVNTYSQNGNANGGSVTDLSNPGSFSDIFNLDITTPGYIRLPVCSGELAYTNWEMGTSSSTEFWPCSVIPSPNDCQVSSFIDETTDASPEVSDCLQIIDNIQGTQGEWTIQVLGEKQRELVSYGTCNFGIQATDEHGNVNFQVGAQDIVDIITECVSLYGGNGQVGAKGYMDCSGNINSQDTLWGLY